MTFAAAATEPPPDPAPAAPDFDAMTEAEQYVVIYPDRAALIRAHGGLPKRVNFGPPDAGLVKALVNGTSPILLALDRPPEDRLQSARGPAKKEFQPQMHADARR